MKSQFQQEFHIFVECSGGGFRLVQCAFPFITRHRAFKNKLSLRGLKSYMQQNIAQRREGKLFKRGVTL